MPLMKNISRLPKDVNWCFGEWNWDSSLEIGGLNLNHVHRRHENMVDVCWIDYTKNHCFLERALTTSIGNEFWRWITLESSTFYHQRNVKLWTGNSCTQILPTIVNYFPQPLSTLVKSRSEKDERRQRKALKILARKEENHTLEIKLKIIIIVDR